MNDAARFLPSFLAGFAENWRSDAISGFLVFLIALPLCFGIAVASGFPPMAGILSAVVGGIVVSRITGSRLTIVGPAAGLITVLLGSVEALGEGDAMAGYHFTLAAVVAAGALQFLLGVFRAGRFATFFPAAVAHGMLAAIGLIIIGRQAPILLGTRPPVETSWQSLAAIPKSLFHFHPTIFLVGGIGLLILFTWRLLHRRRLGRLPAPILVVLTGYALGKTFDLDQSELYVRTLGGDSPILQRIVYTTAPQFLADVPDRFLDSLAWPDFSKAGTLDFWNAVLSLFLIGSLESLLALSAVDRLDPDKHRSNLNRDIAGVGFGNVLSGLIGGMPMVTEIVRSSANIGYGARSGWSNFFHGLFVLLFMLLFPHIIRNIPLASLAALLIYSGYRLSSPRTFTDALEVGAEQLALFVITVAGVLAINILAGVALAIAVKLLIHLGRGVPFRNLFQMSYRIGRQADGSYHIGINGAAVFSNFMALKSELAELPAGSRLVFDFTHADLVDHTVMDFIDRYSRERIARGGECEVRGLEGYDAYSAHPLAARRRKGVD